MSLSVNFIDCLIALVVVAGRLRRLACRFKTHYLPG
jgi:hypothetical protein